MRLGLRSAFRLAMAVLLAVFVVPYAWAQSSNHVLVAYNAKVPDSLAVASHYTAARGDGDGRTNFAVLASFFRHLVGDSQQQPGRSSITSRSRTLGEWLR
jgi:hypothetical protein